MSFTSIFPFADSDYFEDILNHQNSPNIGLRTIFTLDFLSSFQLCSLRWGKLYIKTLIYSFHHLPEDVQANHYLFPLLSSKYNSDGLIYLNYTVDNSLYG